ncbi:MAG: hypothetical protein NTX72_00650 [Candidatus Uhrbacteria bacterium]|nr:hypothetical protein [Candidatus Uhrbacteria bacterium]
MSTRIYVHPGTKRVPVKSLTPHLRTPFEKNFLMDASVMTPEDALTCPWVGYGTGKGVTHLFKDISVFMIPNKMKSGLHGEMVQGFKGVDPIDLCYLDSHKLGFGGFVRWMYFSDPQDSKTEHGVFGLDWSLVHTLTSGIATSMLIAQIIIERAHRHGIPGNARVALMNPVMCEPVYLTEWKQENNLLTVNDWVKKGMQFFAEEGTHCPKCGLFTFEKPRRFCYRCGANRQNTIQEVCHGV